MWKSLPTHKTHFLAEHLILQLTEDWGDTLFGALKKAGGRAYSNMAVGYNNVDVDAATRHGIAVGNTPVRTQDSRYIWASYQEC